jgi:hypothetical protein
MEKQLGLLQGAVIHFQFVAGDSPEFFQHPRV